MANESIHKNPQDLAEEIFVRMKEKFTNISRNMSVLMEALASKLVLFGEVGGLNSEIRIDEKLGVMKTPKRSHRNNSRKSSRVLLP